MLNQKRIKMSAGNLIEGKTILGTVSGTVLTVAMNIMTSDIIKTVILAALGAVVSFAVTVSLKKVWSFMVNFRKRRRKGR